MPAEAEHANQVPARGWGHITRATSRISWNEAASHGTQIWGCLWDSKLRSPCESTEKESERVAHDE